jgi:chemotaxis-related protein WspB
MLILVFRVAGEVYAVEAARIVEVIPCVELRTLPHAPGALAGLSRYRGQTVPVIDLGVLLGAGPCPPRLSTRIILIDEHLPARGKAALGLICEDVSDVRQVAAGQVIPRPAILGKNPHVGPIVSTDSGLIPLLDVERLLAEPLDLSLEEEEAAP